MFNVIYETGSYYFAYDPSYGVGRYVRVVDGAQTLLITGSDCQETLEHIRYLRSMANQPLADELFELEAAEYEYEVVDAI